ncbi:hypothetical protein [Arthrobacter sp. zg-Y769]|uniref:hypothetical protein n=1 Tax=Arthrobacter sp. zg-Y769 TaxID=2894191 RepID=UPI001E2C0A03|nr:hypothetical protein [Arthrobacter sp. zg-Y769]MCC9205842.1 hypothetical protein [Arthrobacter sp. zg-Y769]
MPELLDWIHGKAHRPDFALRESIIIWSPFGNAFTSEQRGYRKRRRSHSGAAGSTI